MGITNALNKYSKGLDKATAALTPIKTITRQQRCKCCGKLSCNKSR